MKTIVHLSADFPDAISTAKTRAVSGLIEAAPGRRHVVYSLNRVNGLGGLESVPSGRDVTALAYGAPPGSLLVEQRMRAVADWIEKDLARQGIRPDLVHAHKFTIEGLAGEQLASRFQTPLLLSIRGDTDAKVASARRDLRARYRALANRAELMAMSVWPLEVMAEVLGDNAARCTIIPSPTKADRILSPTVAAEPATLVSVFHLASWRRKGADNLAAAAKIAAAARPDLRVDIYGGGGAKDVIALGKALRDAGAEEYVRLRGPVLHGEVQATINRYAGFVLPSRRETYGMAYAEALFSGVPIVYSKGRGIDGVLPKALIGAACDPNDPADIARGMLRLVQEQAELKAALADVQAAGVLAPLQLETIGQQYRNILDRLLS